MARPWHNNKIAWKLIKALVLFSSIITLVTTGVQLLSEYDRDLNAIDHNFKLVERSYLDGISENVWQADVGRLNLQVTGIAELPDFRYVTVRDQNDTVLASVGAQVHQQFIQKTYTLRYTFRGQNLVIGELQVVASLAAVYERIWDRVGLILVANAIKTFLVGLFMFSVVYWLLTRHLDDMANFAQRLDFNASPEPLTLERNRFSGQRDELDQLAEALNEMQVKLYKSYDQLNRFNTELENRVLQRTQELTIEAEERRWTAERLGQSEARLRDIVDAGSDWVWEMDCELRFTYLNGKGLPLGEARRQNIIGKRRQDITSDDCASEAWQTHLDDLKNHRAFRDFEYKILNEEGQVRDFRISGKPIFDKAGDFMGYRGVGTDITQAHEVERTIAKVQQDLAVMSSAIQQNPSMIFITDRNGDITYVNEKFTDITGYTLNDVLGRNPRLLKSPETTSKVHNEMWERLNAGKAWRGELKDVRKDGTSFWAYATIAPVKNERGETTHFVATHEDITARKAGEIRLREATKQAKLGSRAKSELMANMSHELRTPLNAIIGFSDSILSSVFGPLGHDRYESYVRDIYNSGHHLLDLINDILDVSAIEAGKMELRPEPLDIIDLVKESMKLIQHRADAAGVTLHLHIEDDIPGLLGDERRIKQILLNLLSNAVKFTPEKGRVTLRVLQGPDGGLRFEVQDTGIGMDEKGIETALSQFGQVDSTLARKYEGTGLGLPLTKSLVEAHGGFLEIHSRLGHGTTVMVQFPSQRSIELLPQAHGAQVKSPDQDAGGELAVVSGDHVDKKIPIVH